MPDALETIAWDFLTLVDCWNLYALPVLLAVVAVALTIRARARSRRAASAWCDGSRTVLLVGLIHLALALGAWISLAQELRSVFATGNAESHFSLVSAFIRSLVYPILAIGLVRRRPWARRLAIAWNAFLALLAVLVVAWLYYYRVGIDIAAWPEQVVPKIRPFFLVVVMFMPNIKKVFAAHAKGVVPKVQPSNLDEASPRATPGSCWPAISVMALLLLIVECSNLIVSTADWGIRLLSESEPVS
jgi:hypothetical protein